MQDTRTALQLIREIDRWSETAELTEVHRLWDILTAMRGPDSDDIDIKYETTARVRHLAFPALAGRAGAIVRGGADDMERLEDEVKSAHFRQESWHFRRHIEMALRALVNMFREDS